MTRKEFRDYVDILRSQDEISYDVYSGLIDGIDTLEREPRWIPMIRREPTDEEKAEYLAQNGEELGYMLENEMPLNGQEVLVSVGEVVSEDIFYEEFFNFENNDIENVDAWMPLPKAYESQESEDEE